MNYMPLTIKMSWIPVTKLILFLLSQLCAFLAFPLPCLSHLSFPLTTVVGPHRSLLSPGPLWQTNKLLSQPSNLATYIILAILGICRSNLWSCACLQSCVKWDVLVVHKSLRLPLSLEPTVFSFLCLSLWICRWPCWPPQAAWQGSVYN